MQSRCRVPRSGWPSSAAATPAAPAAALVLESGQLLDEFGGPGGNRPSARPCSSGRRSARQRRRRIASEDVLLEAVADIHDPAGIGAVLEQNLRFIGLRGIGIPLIVEIEAPVLVCRHRDLADDVRGAVGSGPAPAPWRGSGRAGPGDLSRADMIWPSAVHRAACREGLPGQASAVIQSSSGRPTRGHREIADLADGRRQVLGSRYLV